MLIREARRDDVARIQEIERRAGALFTDVGMAEIADDAPFTSEEIADAHRVWVAVGEDDVPLGYLLALLVDGALHIEQVTIDPDAAGRRIGAALVEEAARHARAEGLPALTLTTFTDVPWNAPYYRRLGFRELSDPGPELRAIREAERVHGLDRWPRTCMIRPL